MGYKKNISDKLALGYGSKYQLLRMLGWHRNDFNHAVANAAGITANINWLDFNYNGPEDKELINFDFIKEQKDEWRAYWACGAVGINWDAVGVTPDGTYVLIEAKAHLKELESTASGGKERQEHNNRIIKQVMNKYGIDKPTSAWSVGCYQLANRLIALDWLEKKGVKAKLVYVLFENGYEFNTPTNKSATSAQWKAAMKNEFERMGIANTTLEKLVNICIIDCNGEKEE